MFDYIVPFKSELMEMDLVPYRTNKKLEEKIRYIFSHVHFSHRELFIDVSTSGSRMLTRDMSTYAVAIVRYFLLNPQQYNHKLDNIHMHIMVQMWKQTFKHCIMQEIELNKYYKTNKKILNIENGLLEELIRTVEDKDYIQSNDDMVKNRYIYTNQGKRKMVGLRDRVYYGGDVETDEFRYLCSLD